MNAREALQERIDAQESYDAIVYGLRSIKVCRGALYCTGPHAGQLARAKTEAASVLGEPVLSVVTDTYREYQVTLKIQAAKVKAAERLRAAKAALKGLGGVKQLRLAIADPGSTLEAA